jgi:hypothetical protein
MNPDPESEAKPAVERRIDYMPLDALKAAPRNPKAHKLEDIGKSIGRFGYVEPIVIDERTGSLVAGHGRLETLQKMKAAGKAPPDGVVVRAGHWCAPVMRGWASRSDADAEAYLLASNQLTIAGGWNEPELEAMLKELVAGGQAEGLGWSEKDLEKLLQPETNQYTGKIQAPIYKPTLPKPPAIGELFAAEKQRQLTADIDAAEGVTDEERQFLRMAALRHVVFDYQNIAEFYAHASAPMQRLMEKSALVIIDFDKAIENGFVKMANDLAEIAPGPEDEEDL